MKVSKKARSHWLPIRLNEEEKRKLHLLYRRTICRSLSEYARAVLLKEPVTVLYRNVTADEFLVEMIHLKNDLNAIRKDFNQAVQKLDSLHHDAEIKAWALLNEKGKIILMKKMEEIGEKLTQIYEQWSQK